MFSNRQFRKNGYAIVHAFLDASELAMLRCICDILLAEPPDDDLGGKAHNIGRGHNRRFLRHRHADFPDYTQFLLSAKMKKCVSVPLGDTCYLFNEQFVVKAAQSQSSFAWHQDSGYVGFAHAPYLTVWIALDDTTQENGPVYLLARDLDVDSTISKHIWDANGKELVGYNGDAEGVAILARAGDAVVFSSLTMHRSGKNKTDKMRRALVAQYTAQPMLDPQTQKLRVFATAL